MGKTTLTHLIAKCLSIDFNKEIMVIDCTESKDLFFVKEHENFKDKKYAYDLFDYEIQDIWKRNVGWSNDKEIDIDEYDYILIDLPNDYKSLNILKRFFNYNRPLGDRDDIIGIFSSIDIGIIPINATYDVDRIKPFINELIKIKGMNKSRFSSFDYFTIINNSFGNKVIKMLEDDKSFFRPLNTRIKHLELYRNLRYDSTILSICKELSLI